MTKGTGIFLGIVVIGVSSIITTWIEERGRL
jgi:hypothetical protein